MSMERTSIVVIGAGPYGIAAARALRDLGSTIVVERGDGPGETWRRRHDRLHLNTIRWLSHLPGERIPRRFGTFPGRDDFVSYLEHAADVLDIRTGCAVERVDRDADGWVVATAGGPLRADHVVVATGADVEPVMPDWPGDDSFSGELMHAADFNELDHADGRRVLVVGPGNSGVDLMNHLLDGGATELLMSARQGMNILPERMFGLPTHPMAVAGRRLPAGIQDAMMRKLQRVAFGDLTEYGYPASDLGVLERIHREQVAPAVDAGFVAGLKAGRIRMCPAIERFDGDRVVFEDGTIERPDLVVCATGYRPGIEHLVGDLVELDGFGFPQLSGNHQDIGLPGLWFFGIDRDPYGNLSVLRAETRRFRKEFESVVHRQHAHQRT
jgi:putative flavoprotein involved in K+ transport